MKQYSMILLLLLLVFGTQVKAISDVPDKANELLNKLEKIDIKTLLSPRRVLIKPTIENSELNPPNVFPPPYNEVKPITNGEHAIAIGTFSVALGDQSIAIGVVAAASRDNSIAIGNSASARGEKSLALGYRVSSTRENAFVIGTGIEQPAPVCIDVLDEWRVPRQHCSSDVSSAFVGRLENTLPNSLAIGFNSDTPTMIVTGGSGLGTSGNVGIGTLRPEHKLHVVGGARIEGNSYLNGHVAIRDLFSPHILANSSDVVDFKATTAKITDHLSADTIEAVELESSTARFNILNVDNGGASIHHLFVPDFVSANEISGKSIFANHLKVSSMTAADIRAASLLTENIYSNGVAHIKNITSSEISTGKLFANDINSTHLLNGETAVLNSLSVGWTNTKKGLSVKEVAQTVDTPAIKSVKTKITNAEGKLVTAKRNLQRYLGTGSEATIRNNIANLERSLVTLNSQLNDLYTREGAQIDTMVGIGTSAPKQKLHISGAMRLEPMEFPPSVASSGDMYYDSSNALCVYMIDRWERMVGSGYCE